MKKIDGNDVINESKKRAAKLGLNFDFSTYENDNKETELNLNSPTYGKNSKPKLKPSTSPVTGGKKPAKTEKLNLPSKLQYQDFKLISFNEITNAKIKENPLIDGIVEEKGSTIFAGPSGAGKSLLANFIALTAGMPAAKVLWGLFPISRPLKSLVLQSENNLIQQNKRLNTVFKVNPELQQGVSNVMTVGIGNDCRISGILTNKPFQNFLLEMLEKSEADLLILDPLISYHEQNENDNVGMRKALDCLTMICDQGGAATIIFHHFNRLNQTRGAAAIRDWCSNMFLLEIEKENGPSTILKTTHDKARNFEKLPVFYLERTPDLQFLKCETPGKQFKKIDATIAALAKLGGKADSQIILKNAVMIELNCSEATARRAINQALKAKKIIIIPGNKKYESNSYRLL